MVYEEAGSTIKRDAEVIELFTREEEQWAELLAEAGCLDYDAYEFMYIRLGGEPRRCVLDLKRV